MSFSGCFYFHPDSHFIPSEPTNKNWEIVFYNSGYIQIDKIWARTLTNPFILSSSTQKEIGELRGYTEDRIANSSLIFVNESDFETKIKYLENYISFGFFFDEAKAQLHIARDAFGNIPIFYYHQKNKFVAFSSDVKTLLSLPVLKGFTSINIDQETIYKYLNIKYDSTPYSKNTFYKGISSVIPGSIVSFNSFSSSSKQYNLFHPAKWVNLKKSEEYGEVFVDLLRKSVKRSVSGVHTLGAQLSGGLDSSSICCLTKELRPNSPLHAFYSETDSYLSNEKNFSLIISNSINAIHHSIRPSTNEIELAVHYTSLYNGPEQMALSPSFQGSLIAAAKQFNCQVLLTGHDGDSIVGSGRSYISSIFKKHDWTKLRSLLYTLIDRTNYQQLNGNWTNLGAAARFKTISLHYFNREIIKDLKNQNFRDALIKIDAGRQYFKLSYLDFAQPILKSLKQKMDTFPRSIHNSSLETSNTEADYVNSEEQQRFLNGILFNQNIRINEQYYAISKHNNLSIRHPFFDSALYELCLAVPTEIKFGEGLGRGHLRQAMIGILPEVVRLRKDKAIFNTYASESALRLYSQAQDFLTNSSPVWEFVDKSKFYKALSILKSSPTEVVIKHSMTFFVNRTIFLSIWLDGMRLK